jgi:MoaA/NifB/PqqE/SkfB family radical SAM enzyme
LRTLQSVQGAVSTTAAAGVIAAKLARNGLYYRYLRLAGRPGRPQAVSLEVTHRCVCRCVMCNIWKIPQTVADLPLRDWVALLSDDLLSDVRELDITGGEPFLRDDLVALIRAVCDLKQNHLTRLRSVAITTNGVLSERVVRMVEEMLLPMSAASLGLIVVCALDAVDDTHDRIRRFPGAFEQVDSSIAGLMRLRERFPGLVIGVKTTVLPENVGKLEQIAGYATDRGLFTIISPAIVTGGRYLNRDRAEGLALTAGDRAALACFYEGSAFKWSYHAEVLAHFLRAGRMDKPCSCGLNYLFVRSTGDVHLCPLMEETVGNVRAASVGELLTSSEARRVRAQVGKMPACALCTEPGIERYSPPYEGFAYLSTLVHMGPRAFLELHAHLGLDKYV